MFRPLTKDIEQRRSLMEESLPKDIILAQVEGAESLMDYYHIANQMKNGVFAKMQLYVLDNYKEVPLEVWNEEYFTITPHLENEEIIFGKEDEFKSSYTKAAEVFRDFAKRRYDKAVKIESISFTLDPCDGDFSVNFNGGNWSFLWEDDIIEYYLTVYNYLNKE